MNIYGVPRNMTVARRPESRLCPLILFVIFSLQPSLTGMIIETTNLVLALPNCGLPFCAVNILEIPGLGVFHDIIFKILLLKLELTNKCSKF